MAAISDIEQDVLGLLEEPSAPQFWDLQNEVRVAIVEAMNEAALITGEPQLRLSSSPYAIAANQTLQPMAPGLFAITRIEGAGSLPVRKVSVWDLDLDNPTWQNELDTGANHQPGVVEAWFPFGLGVFGVYPQITVAASLIITGVQIPVNTARPYTGAETIPYGSEFTNAFQDYGAHYCRLKEGGVDFDQSQQLYQAFLSDVGQLAKLATRKTSLRWTKNAGPLAKITEIERR